MFNKQLKRNANAVDVAISKLLVERLAKATTDTERKEILEQAKQFAELRDKISESKARESLVQYLLPGAIGIGSMWMVLNYEKAGIITSKAYAMAQKMFRGH